MVSYVFLLQLEEDGLQCKVLEDEIHRLKNELGQVASKANT